MVEYRNGKKIILGAPAEYNYRSRTFRTPDKRHWCKTMRELPDEEESRGGYGLHGNKVLYSAGDTSNAYSRNMLVMINTSGMNDIRIEDRASFNMPKRSGSKYIPGFHWSVPILYCPFCGEKLIEEGNNETD